MISEQEFTKLQKRVADLEAGQGKLRLPIDPLTKGAIENSNFSVLRALFFKGGLPVYTVARDTTVDIPKHGEAWLEDVSGPTRRICAYIVAPVTGIGTKYSVAIT